MTNAVSPGCDQCDFNSYRDKEVGFAELLVTRHFSRNSEFYGAPVFLFLFLTESRGREASFTALPCPRETRRAAFSLHSNALSHGLS